MLHASVSSSLNVPHAFPLLQLRVRNRIPPPHGSLQIPHGSQGYHEGGGAIIANIKLRYEVIKVLSRHHAPPCLSYNRLCLA